MTTGVCNSCGGKTADYRSKSCASCYKEAHGYPVMDTEEDTIKERNKLRYINRRNYVYRKRYRIDEPTYQKMLEEQNYCCAICGTNQSELSKRMSVDHDHQCCPGLYSCGNCLRGLLCSACNLALGGFKDDENVLKSALNYISSYRNEEYLDESQN